MRKNIAILASGRGTNAENIIRYFAANPVAQVSWVLTNKEQAPVLKRAETWGVETAFFNKELWLSGKAIAAELARKHIDLVVLAGFLAKVPDAILHNYPERIINIHPSLLPKFGGKGMYGDHVHQAVIAAGESESGITIHYINEAYDEGAIVCQQRCPVYPDDTPQTLAERVHALEYKYYPRVIEELAVRLDESSIR